MGICWEPHCLTWIYRRARQPGVRQPELADIGARLTAVDDSLGGQAEAVRGVLARWPLPPVYPGAVDLLALAGRSDRNVEPAVRLGMLVIRVAIQEPSARETRAHHLVSDLQEAGEVLVASLTKG